MDRIQRITEMEKACDDVTAAIRALSDAAARYEKLQGSYRKLSAYYGSARWRGDLEADEKGLLPSELKRGVLSEDGLYDLMTENRELAVRLLRLAARTVENG